MKVSVGVIDDVVPTGMVCFNIKYLKGLYRTECNEKLRMHKNVWLH